jgi:DNA repair photolyase
MATRKISRPPGGFLPFEGEVPGRGALQNPESRFLKERYEPNEEDPWPEEETSSEPDETQVHLEEPRTVISRNESPDVPFELSLNPYRGCEHGCIYCYARPTHAYLGLSPGRDFETKLTAKTPAPQLLSAELQAPGYRVQPLALGTNTDPYQPIERRFKITRGVLEVLWQHRHPVMITTKSALILRDLDLLVALAGEQLVHVFVSLTTLDRELARRLEPRAAAPNRRLETIEKLSQAGVPVGVMVAPVIPALTDTELEQILEAAKLAGAWTAGYILLRLPQEVAGLFENWLLHHVPLRAQRILARVRDLRRGKLNDPRFGSRMRGEGVWAELLARRFQIATRRLGLDRALPELDTRRFLRSPAQLSLF